MSNSRNQLEHRRTVVVIVAPIQGEQCLHFTSTKLKGYTECDPVTGFKDGGKDEWFPVRQSLFITIEALMVEAKVAHNVTNVKFLRESGPSTDYEVTYNNHQG